MDQNTATVVLALIAAVVAPIVTFAIKYIQDREIARRVIGKVDGVAEVAAKTAEVAAKTAEVADTKLSEIQYTVNGRLTDAMARIELLERLLESERVNRK